MNVPNAQSVFGRAAEIPDPAERDAYLDAACLGRPDVRAEVETLLRALGAAGSFMRVPAAGADATREYDSDIPEGEGTVIGPYTLREQIGEGGMGLVFVAEQTHPVRRKVALKVIKPGMDTRQVVARFEAERQALALMDHPNIARVLDAGTTASGLPYFVMELVRGVPITEYADANRFTTQQRLELFVQVCHAVHHAHQKGVIHRDLKPTNILVAPHDGVPVVKVIDFGVAKAVGQTLTEKTIYTRFAQMIGTPLYMSPEQAEVNQLDVDTRSDVYALGVVLYELLTGTTPFDGERFRRAAFDEMRRIIKEEEPPRPSTRLTSLGATLTATASKRGTDPGKLAGVIRGELDWIVMRCLEKDRTRRYDGATALVKDVQRYLSGDAVEACPPTLCYRLKKAYRRNRAAVLVGSAFLGLVLGAAVVGGLLAVQARRAEQIAEKNAEEARIARDAEVERRAEAERLGAELRQASYFTNINLAAASLELGQVGRTLQLLDVTRPTGGQQNDHNKWEWHYLRRAAHGEQSKIGELPVRANAVAMSPNGHFLAVGGGHQTPTSSEPGQVRVWDRRSGRELYAPLAIDAQFVNAVAYSPDGRILVANGYNIFAGRPERTRSEVRAWDAATGKHFWTREIRGLISLKPLHFSPDGKTLALLCNDNETDEPDRLLKLDAPSGAIRSDESLPGQAFSSEIAFTATGNLRLAIVTKDEVLTLLDSPPKSDGKLVFDAAAIKTRIYRHAFNSPATHLAMVTRDRQIRVWDVTGPQPVLSGAVRADFAPPTSRIVLSPDGGTVALIQGFYGNPLVGVWDVKTGQQIRVLRGHTGRVQSAAFGPDGRTLATASDDRTARVWDVSQKPAWEAGPHPTLSPSELAGGPDGRFSVVTRTSDNPEEVTEFAVSDLETGCLRFRSPKRAKGSSRSFLAPYLRLSPDGSRVAASSWVAEDRVQVWDISTGRPAAKLPTDGVPGQRVWFGTPDQLVTSLGGTIDVWDLTTGTRVRQFGEANSAVIHVAVTPDGRFLVAHLSDRSQRVWDVTTGELVQKITNPEQVVQSIALSGDGHALAVGRQDGKIVLWDVRTGRQVRLIDGHVTNVRQVRFSPDGRRLFSHGTEGLVKVWDTETGQEVLTLRHDGIIRAMALSSDGHRLATVQNPFNGGQIFDATPLPEERNK